MLLMTLRIALRALARNKLRSLGGERDLFFLCNIMSAPFDVKAAHGLVGVQNESVRTESLAQFAGDLMRPDLKSRVNHARGPKFR